MQKSTINTFSECGHHSCTVYYGICFRNENQGTEFSFVWYKKFQERYVRQFFFSFINFHNYNTSQNI